MFEHPMFSKSYCQASVHVNKTILRGLVSFGRNKKVYEVYSFEKETGVLEFLTQ